MSDRVVIEVADRVAHVRMNRPDKLNALDTAMFVGLAEAGESLKGRDDVRAVVLSGEGRGFCAGLDFGSFQQMASGTANVSDKPARDQSDSDDSPAKIFSTEDRITHLGQQACWVWQELDVPVIAAVHGVALGGGIQIALGADLRIVAPDARMSVLEVRWGLIPDMTGTYMLPRLVGLDVAKELTFTGRMVSGEEAVKLGLATRVSDDPIGDALALAAELAGKSPAAIRGAKQLLNASTRASAADQFAAERATIGSLIGSPNQVEAVMAYFEKREPNFT